MSQFWIHGPVPTSSSAYVHRAFEVEAYRHLVSGRWVLLLGPRQHGKTTGLLRIRDKLRAISPDGVALVDLQTAPPCSTYDGLAEWFGRQLSTQLGCAAAQAPLDRFDISAWISQSAGVGQTTSIFILIDEAGNLVNSDHRNTFYGQIRGIATRRADAQPTDVAARVSFLFAGMFRPEQLVSEHNSPFNVCENIFTEDLTYDSARELWTSVTGDLDFEEVCEAAFKWVGGQPYLLQKLFDKAFSALPGRKRQSINTALEDLWTGGNSHFKDLMSRVFNDDALTEIVELMTEQGSISYDPGNGNYLYLRTLGIARQQNRNLAWRNRLYHEMAKLSFELRRKGQSHFLV